MIYKLKSEPYFPNEGAEPVLFEIEGAVKAWETVHGLMMSDETVTIHDASGREIDWTELRERAEKEVN